MVEYDNVKDAVEALIELNTATSIVYEDPETGNTRLAMSDDIQQDNMEIIYQLVNLLGLDLDELEA